MPSTWPHTAQPLPGAELSADSTGVLLLVSVYFTVETCPLVWLSVCQWEQDPDIQLL